MKLKLTDDSNLNPSGSEHTPEPDSPDILSNRHPDSEPKQEADWELDTEPYVISQSIITEHNAYDNAAQSHDLSSVVPISCIILYLLYVTTAGAIMWIAAQDSIMLIDNIRKFSPLFSLMNLYIIIDAFIVFFLYEKRASLLVFAFLLGNFYPIKRSQVIHGSGGNGTLICVFYLITVLGLGLTGFKASMTYGGLLVADSSVRQEAVAMFEQIDSTGQTYGDILQNNLTIAKAGTETQNGNTYFVLTGYGDLSINDEGTFIVGMRTMQTILVFVKDSKNNSYSLVMATLNGKTLTDYRVDQYWSLLQDE